MYSESQSALYRLIVSAMIQGWSIERLLSVIVSPQGDCVVHKAAADDDVQALTLLAACGVSPQALLCRRPGKGHAGHVAARHGHVEVVRVLLALGVSPSELLCAQDNGDTMVHIAAQWGRTAVVDVLAAACVSPHALMRGDELGNTPAHVAAWRQQACIVTALAGAGVGPALLMRANRNGWTPAHFAASVGAVGVLEALCRSGVSLKHLMAPDHHGMTPAHVAVVEERGRAACIDPVGCQLGRTVESSRPGARVAGAGSPPWPSRHCARRHRLGHRSAGDGSRQSSGGRRVLTSHATTPWRRNR